MSLCDLVTKDGTLEISFKTFLGNTDPVRGQYLLVLITAKLKLSSIPGLLCGREIGTGEYFRLDGDMKVRNRWHKYKT